nr:ADOP family duplicated permease [Acidobacteriota bacterium]
MLFRRRRFDRDMKAELLSHIEERAAEYERDGVAPAEARRLAAVAFGNAAVIHEQSRDVWLVRWFEHMRRDARIALRMLAAAPGFAAAAIATLALGIGANTAIFTIVDALLLRPLPYADAGRLVEITPGFPRGAAPVLRAHGHHFSGTGGFSGRTEVTWTGGAEPLRLNATLVTGDLLPLLGVPAERGRAIEPGDERFGAEPVAVVSHGFWMRHLGGDPHAIGRSVTINDRPRRIAGVMPAAFRFPDASTDLWIPITINPPDPIQLWTATGLRFIARLQPGASVALAQSDVPRLGALIRDAFPWPMPTRFGDGAVIVPLQQATMAGVRDGFVLLSVAVAFVLMVACANVATLLLARSESRARELAIRGALGAGRRRLTIQLIIEGGILASLGAAAGFTLLAVALPALSAALPAGVPRVRDLTIDMRVAGFAFGAALITTLVTGLLPAIRAGNPDVTSALRSGDTRAGRRTRAFSVLVAVEVALALVLVAGSGLMLRSLSRLTAVDPGFDVTNLATAQVHPIESRYPTPAARIDLYRRILEGAGALPGVTGVAAASGLPLDGNWGPIALSIEAHPLPAGAPAWTPDQRVVTPAYFDVMRIPMREGRAFDDRDTPAAPGAIIINETMARRYWSGRSAVGQRVKPVWQTEWRTIVGVAADTRNRDLGASVEDEIYIPYAQNPAGSLKLVMRLADGGPRDLGAALRHVMS